MKHRFYTLVFGVIFTLSYFNLNGQGFGFIIDSVQIQTGTDFCVSVKTKEYTEILTLQFALSWNQDVIKFKQTKNYNLPGWGPTDFSLILPNELLGTWADPAGVCSVRDSGHVLFDVCFSAIGAVGSNTYITIDTGEAFICLAPIGLVPIDKDSGLVVIIGQSATSTSPPTSTNPFQLNPNPTQTSTQLTFQSTSSAKAMLLVTNTLGQLVFQQNVSVQIGENQFEIPSSALNIKGMYQVSLKTEQGVSSKMLSVH